MVSCWWLGLSIELCSMPHLDFVLGQKGKSEFPWMEATSELTCMQYV